MRKLIVIIVLLALSAPCFAGGGLSHQKDIREVKDCVTKGELDAMQKKFERKLADANRRISEASKKEIVKEVVTPKPEPSKGLAVGFHGAIPTITYNGKWYDVEVGYSSINSDPRGIVKAGLSWISDHEDYTILKTGLALIKDNGTRIGLYGGAEQYIEKSISVTGDVYVLTSGDTTDILTATVGGRLYF